jgi:UDP-N-acetylmuramoyl-tripeptide--D-alanyl-D-alanine ligase
MAGPPDALVRSVCTDSRKASAGDLFFALRGERFDGHAFVAEVAKKGAVAVVVDRCALPVPAGGMAVIVVENARAALGRLAARYRNDFQLPVVAVAGSNGKSTTKELIASVLRPRLSTLWSEASFNNDIGVPLTLLQLGRHHHAAVLEVGTNHPGELAPLVAMIQPRFGVITSIGREHLEYFGDLASVAQEEGALAEMLPPEGRLFLNTADAAASQLAARSRAPVVRIGWTAENDWSPARVEVDERGAAFGVNAPRREFGGTYRLNLLGRHQVLSALLAMAVGAELGLAPAEVRRGLEDCRPLKMRLQLWEAGGVRVLDDSYNANADSMLAALQTLKELPCAGRRIAVLGDMAELGAQSAAAHAEVGRWAAQAGLERLYTVGTSARLLAASAFQAGLRQVCGLDDVALAAGAVMNFIRPGDVILLKASRATGLDRVGTALREALDGNGHKLPLEDGAPVLVPQRAGSTVSGGPAAATR